MLIQVIDAMEHKGDCQPEHLSRKLACTQPGELDNCGIG